MKKLLAILLTATLLLSACMFSTNAVMKPYSMGDVNCDDNVNIFDVTMLQQILASLTESSPAIEYLGNVDSDDELSILDATYIQLWIAGIIEDSDIDGWNVFHDIYIHDFYADYESGKAMVGTPVTFTVNADSNLDFTAFELYVEHELVATSEDNTITYTFEEAGVFSVEVRVHNVFGYASQPINHWTYKVVEPYDETELNITTKYITGKYLDTMQFDYNSMTAYVEATGGVAPYQYKFVFNSFQSSDYDEKPFITKTQDYSDKNYYEFGSVKHDDLCNRHDSHFSCEKPCTLTVYVKDSNGVEVTETMNFYFTNEIPIG